MYFDLLSPAVLKHIIFFKKKKENNTKLLFRKGWPIKPADILQNMHIEIFRNADDWLHMNFMLFHDISWKQFIKSPQKWSHQGNQVTSNLLAPFNTPHSLWNEY